MSKGSIIEQWALLNQKTDAYVHAEIKYLKTYQYALFLATV